MAEKLSKRQFAERSARRISASAGVRRGGLPGPLGNRCRRPRACRGAGLSVAFVLAFHSGVAFPDASTPPLAAPSARARCADYRPLSAEQSALGEVLFTEMLAGAGQDESSLRQRWAALGYELSEKPRDPRGWWQLEESATGCRGQGYYLIRERRPVRLVLQVPHAYADLHTGDIAATMLNGPFDVIAWNTTARHTAADGDDGPADLARRDDSLLAALTRSLARGHADVRVVQLHGFANERRKTAAGARAAVIVSSGSRWPTPAADAFARCLAEFVEGPVAVFPRDVTELGATTNLHGAILRRSGHEGFIHVEMNLPTRRRLLTDARWQRQFSACLGNG